MSQAMLEQKQSVFKALVAKYDVRSKPAMPRKELSAEERRHTAPLSSARGQGFSLLR